MASEPPDHAVLEVVSAADAINSHLAIGRKLLRTGDFAGAISAYEKVTKLDPQHIGARGDIVIALQRQGKTQAAIKSLRQLLVIAPRNVVLLTQLGHLLHIRTNWQDAEAAFNEALAIDPTLPGALGGLASTLHRQGKSDQALGVLHQATGLWPKNPGMLVREALLLEEFHRLKEAKLVYQKALAADPGNKAALAGLRRTRNPEHVFAMIHGLLANTDDAALAELLGAELSLPAQEVVRLVSFAAATKAEASDAIAKTPHDLAVLETVMGASRRAAFAQEHGAAAPLNRRQMAPATLDCLAEPASHDGWTPAQWINAYALRQTKVRFRAAVVVTMRDEGLYILEWVAHYRALGFDTIFVYSNDNIDKSEGLLCALAASGIITYIENQMDPGQDHHPQRKAYAHALHLLPELWEHEWVLFADGDEFLIPAPHYDCILTLLDDAVQYNAGRPPSAICFNWFMCFSDFIYDYHPEILLERFQHGAAKRGMKSLVRLRDIYSMHLIHFPDMAHDGFLVTSDFRRLEKIKRQKRLEPVLASARLNHYWTKSFEEFSLKKARGDASASRDRLWLRDFELFFTKNEEQRPANYAPVPEQLIKAVDKQVEWLKTLAGVADALAQIQTEWPKLLARFDHAGGLPLIYQTTKMEALKLVSGVETSK